MDTAKQWLTALSTLLLLSCSSNTPLQAGKSGSGTPQSQQSGSGCQVIQHDAGETQLCGQPQQVVALDPHTLDILLSLNVQPIGYAEEERALLGRPQIGVPIAQIKYLGDRVKSSPTSVGTRLQPSLEAIAQLGPDLIVGENFNDLSYNNLVKIAPTLFLSGNGRDDWKQNLQVLGKALGRETVARQVIQQHNQHIASAKAQLAPITRQSNVLLMELSGLDGIEVYPNQTYPGDLLADLGFNLVLPGPVENLASSRKISLEVLPQLDADLIFVMASGENTVENAKAQWEKNPILRSLPPSQDGRVYFVDYQLWNRIRGPIAAELMVDEVLRLLRS